MYKACRTTINDGGLFTATAVNERINEVKMNDGVKMTVR